MAKHGRMERVDFLKLNLTENESPPSLPESPKIETDRGTETTRL